MKDVNLCTFTGTVDKSDKRFTSSGKAVCSFTLICYGESKEGKTYRTYVNCVRWGEDGPEVGSRAFVQGTLGSRSYEAKDGNKRWVTEINVYNLQVLAAEQDSGDTDASFSEDHIKENDIPF